MGITFSKGEESRKRVLNAALELFIEQGYERTTMRQIVQRSGVLNGSVYHAFRNKDDLFEHIFNLILDRVFDDLDVEGTDVLTFLMVPASVEIFYAYRDPRLAELIYHANRSWNIFNSIVGRLEGYLRKYSEEMKIPFDEAFAHRYFLTTVGMASVFVNEYHLTDNRVSVRTNLRFLMEYICAVTHIPLMDPEAALDRVIGKVDVQKDFLKDLKF